MYLELQKIIPHFISILILIGIKNSIYIKNYKVDTPSTQTVIQSMARRKNLPSVVREEQHINQTQVVPSTQTQIQNITRKKYLPLYIFFHLMFAHNKIKQHLYLKMLAEINGFASKEKFFV